METKLTAEEISHGATMAQIMILAKRVFQDHEEFMSWFNAPHVELLADIKGELKRMSPLWAIQHAIGMSKVHALLVARYESSLPSEPEPESPLVA